MTVHAIDPAICGVKFTTQLTLADKNILQPGGWLNDKHIHAAQQLLKMQYPGVQGLQDPLLQSTHTFDIQ